MLCQFSFQNFKSYRDETVFDLQATAIPEFKDNLIVKDKCSDLLPVSVIYGPNGGGMNIPVRQHRKSGRRETVCPGLRKPLMRVYSRNVLSKP